MWLQKQSTENIDTFRFNKIWWCVTMELSSDLAGQVSRIQEIIFQKGKFHDNSYKSLAKKCFYKYIYTVFSYSEALFLFWVYEWPGLVVVTRLVKHTKTMMKTENARCSRVNSFLLSSLPKKSFSSSFLLIFVAIYSWMYMFAWL